MTVVSAIKLTVWDTLNATLSFKTNDAQFWWDRVGHTYANLLDCAGYTTSEQYAELQFFALFVVPQLGPGPGKDFPWSSLRAPDQTPIEFSWEWRSEHEGILRYSFEPIVPAWPQVNVYENPTRRLLQTWQNQNLIPGLNLEWFEHFSRTMVPPGLKHIGHGPEFYARSAAVFGTSLAVDAYKTGKIIKAYFWPDLNAKMLGISGLECVRRAINALPVDQRDALQAESAFKYLEEATERWGLYIGQLSVDCIRPEDARIKIYVSSPWTSREFIMDSLTMGGRLPKPEDDALENLTSLWDTFLGEAPDKVPEDIMELSKQGFFLSLGYGGKKSVKMYLSPKYWCDTDGEVLSRLRKYFVAHGTTDRMISRYENTVRNVLGSAIVDGRFASHQYVGCEVAKGKPRVVTYMCPQTLLIEHGNKTGSDKSSEETSSSHENL